MKVAIIGSGAYACALSKVLLANKCDITMWTELEDKTHIDVSEDVKITNLYEEALKNTEVIYVLTSSKFCKEVFESIKEYYKDQLIVLGSKGIIEDGTLLTQLLETIIPDAKYAVISGPTFAIDISSLEPIGFTVGTKFKDDYEIIRSTLSTINLEYFEDPDAIEILGSLKNAYAIGSGILSGLHYSESTRCLYITKVLQEIKFILTQLNYDANAVLTLAGVGDLVLTCTSHTSRNFTFGEKLALETHSKIKEYLETNTVEGKENLKVFAQLFQKQNIQTSLLDCIINIITDNSNPRKLIELLLKK